MTVLTGPVFRDDDPVDLGVRIPQDFFKIAAYLDDDGNLCTAGWLQRPPLQNAAAERAQGFLGRFLMWQVPIARVAELTGLDLGPLLSADALGRRRCIETSGLNAVPIAAADDLML